MLPLGKKQNALWLDFPARQQFKTPCEFYQKIFQFERNLTFRVSFSKPRFKSNRTSLGTSQSSMEGLKIDL